MSGDVVTAIVAAIAAVLGALAGAAPGILAWRRQTRQDQLAGRLELARLQEQVEARLWERMKGELDEQEQEIALLRGRIEALEQENRDLREENRSLREKLATAEEEMEHQARQIGALESKNQQLEDQMKGLSTQ